MVSILHNYSKGMRKRERMRFAGFAECSFKHCIPIIILNDEPLGKGYTLGVPDGRMISSLFPRLL